MKRWNILTTLNLSTGEYEWQIAVGNDEKLQEKGGAITGLLARSGYIVTTGGLVFISGAADKNYGRLLRALVKWFEKTLLPAASNLNVCSYSIGENSLLRWEWEEQKQNPSGSIMAFALQIDYQYDQNKFIRPCYFVTDHRLAF